MPEVNGENLLTFKIKGQYFGICVEDVKEIIKVPEITEIPNSSQYMVGVINLRGRIISVFNLALLMNKGMEEVSEKSRVIVVEKNDNLVGFIVDEVTEVVKFEKEFIEENLLGDEFLRGIVKGNKGKLILLLDFSNILSYLLKNVQAEVKNKDKMNINNENIKSKQERQIVSFKLKDQEFGIEVNKIKEIIRYDYNISEIPNSPRFVEGMINLRGILVPVINLRKFFSMDSKEKDDYTRIIIVLSSNKLFGLTVDKVNEVLRVPESLISLPPSFSENNGYINEVVKKENRLILMLNTEKILTDSGNINLLDNANLEEEENKVEDSNELQVVTFEVNSHLFGFEISAIKEINKVNSVTPLPCTPDYIRGIVNLRGELVTIIDINSIFYNIRSDLLENTRIIIMEKNRDKIGVIAEKVHEVRRVKKEILEDVKNDEAGIENKYIKYILKDSEKMVIILDEKFLFEL